MEFMRVYADHAATTGLDRDAFEAMKAFLLEEFGNASQPYSFAQRAREAVKSARRTIAACIHAEPEEIFFTSGGTESNNWAIKATAFATAAERGAVIAPGRAVGGHDEFAIAPGGTVGVHGEATIASDRAVGIPDESAIAPGPALLTSAIEHHSVLRACQAAERAGIPVGYLPADPGGLVLPEELRRRIGGHTRLVSVMYANNEIGTLQPVKELCEIAHAKGALFHTDAVQAAGHVPIDVKALGVDMLSASAHKFNGPKGIGFLYIKKGIKLVPWMDGGAQESGLRAGTENVASIVAMAVALEKSCMRMERAGAHLKKLEEQLLSALKEAELDFLRNGGKERIPGSISLSFRHMESEMLLHRLDFMGISVSAGSACDSTNPQLSHVLKAIGVPAEYAPGTIRISLGWENTEEEIAWIAQALTKIIKSE